MDFKGVQAEGPEFKGQEGLHVLCWDGQVGAPKYLSVRDTRITYSTSQGHSGKESGLQRADFESI